MLSNADEMQNSQKWFSEVESMYIDRVKAARHWLKINNFAKSDTESID